MDSPSVTISAVSCCPSQPRINPIHGGLAGQSRQLPVQSPPAGLGILSTVLYRKQHYIWAYCGGEGCHFTQMQCLKEATLHT